MCSGTNRHAQMRGLVLPITDRPLLAIVAERQHPGIDDLPSSSSAGLTVELNATILGTLQNALWPSS